MKFIKLTIIALVGLFMTTTSCKKEEPKPETPTHLGVWELIAIRSVYYENSKIKYEETDSININSNFIERLEFKDASNGSWTWIYPNTGEPEEIQPFTYKIEGDKLSVTDSEGEFVFDELNIQTQTLTFADYEIGSATDPNRQIDYWIYKRI